MELNNKRKKYVYLEGGNAIAYELSSMFFKSNVYVQHI